MTELPVALEACNSAIRAWDAGPGRPIIINLPTTVENATPNVYADQIEWMSNRLERREHVVGVVAHAQRPRHRRRRRRARHAGRRGSRRRLSVRQRRALGQRRSRESRAQLLFAGHPPRPRFLGHQRDRARSGAGHAPADPPAPSVRRRSGVHVVLGLAPGRDQERHGRAEDGCALGSAVHPGRSGRSRPYLRQRRARQQPVGQGRHRLSARARLRRRDAAAHAGRVQRARAARDGHVGDRDDLAAALGCCSRRPISPPISTSPITRITCSKRATSRASSSR